MGACLISSVENGVVIVSFSKDYEIESWNEQGEILQKEGMLTICFSYISLCSHKDRKELYLIMKIPYLVNMPQDYEILLKSKLKNNIDRLELFDKLVPSLLKEFEKEKSGRIILENEFKNFKSKIQKADLKDMDFGLGKGLLPVNLDKYAEWVVKVPKLEQRVKELESIVKELKPEVEKLKNEKQQLKVLCGKADSGWIYELNWIYRYTPDTGEPIGHDCPKNFNYSRLTGIRYYLKDGVEWCTFRYKNYGRTISDDYTMPKDAFLWLKGGLPEQKKKSKEIDIHDLENEEDIKNYYLHKGGTLRGKYPIKVIKFLNKTKGDTFDIHEFNQYCGFKDNRESRRLYKNKLIEWGLIKQTKNQRVCQNLI